MVLELSSLRVSVVSSVLLLQRLSFGIANRSSSSTCYLFGLLALLLLILLLFRRGGGLIVALFLTECDNGSALLSFADADSVEAGEVLLHCVVDQEPPTGVHRGKQQRSAEWGSPTSSDVKENDV